MSESPRVTSEQGGELSELPVSKAVVSFGKHRTRVLTALLVFALAVFVVWAGLPLLAPAYLLLTLIAIQEYSALMAVRGIPIRKRSLWVAAILTLPAALPHSYPGMPVLSSGFGWREALLTLFTLYLLALEVSNPNRRSLYAVVFTLFGYIYIPWQFSFLITLRYTPDGVLGLWYLAIPLLALVASDVGAYVIGTLFGKNRLAPKISPNKSIEGSLGGLGLAMLVVAGATALVENLTALEIRLYDVVLFSLLVACMAQLGDLFESLLKRWAGVKDAGAVLPGHGGVLDRIDSALMAFPVSYLFVTLVILR